ncbi:uncharacterized protein [Physcomitrium patens]|uniref:uncharacterized protein isoform X1 n=1 Tax=Physcomitrium patens TaxID=3218 RepID=UPI003CCE417B
MAICSLVEAVQRWIAARVPGGVAVSPKVFLPSLVLFPWSDVLWTVGSATLWCGFFFLRWSKRVTFHSLTVYSYASALQSSFGVEVQNPQSGSWCSLRFLGQGRTL